MRSTRYSAQASALQIPAAAGTIAQPARPADALQRESSRATSISPASSPRVGPFGYRPPGSPPRAVYRRIARQRGADAGNHLHCKLFQLL